MQFSQKDIDRFWSQVDKSGDCWVWIGALSSNGYGEIYFNHQHLTVHRTSWLIAHGNIPNGMYVCHHCDNKQCVNPSHLYIGTHLDNTRDAVVRHRMATGNRQGSHTHPETVHHGESHGMVKLTNEQVLMIRNSRNVKQRDIAKQFGVHFSTICDILRGKTWKHLL